MDCPRCNPTLPLQSVRVKGKSSLDFCPNCSGVWLGPDDVLNLLRNQVPKGVQKQPDPPLACPSCSSLLMEIESTQPAVPTIDQCMNCGGVWFDQGEMNALKAWTENSDVLMFTKHKPSTQTSDGTPQLLPLRAQKASDDPNTVDWVWLTTGFVVLVGMLGAMSLFLGIWNAADAMGTTTTSTTSTWAMGGTGIIGAFFVGGLFIGWKSHGFTVMEPAIAAIPAAFLCPLLFGSHFSTVGLLTVTVLGFVCALLGAATGEHFSR